MAKSITGIVSSDKADKTIVVTIQERKTHRYTGNSIRLVRNLSRTTRRTKHAKVTELPS